MRLMRPALLTLLVGLALTPAHAQQSRFNEAEQRAIGEIVREYLLGNPEVLQEAISELERRNVEAQQAARATVLQSEHGKIFRSAADYVIGNPNGDVTLVEFLDYNCGYCKQAVGDVKELIRTDPKLRVVLKDFPVLGPGSLQASQVALAAKYQLRTDQLSAFHLKLMELKGTVNEDRAKGLAKEIGLDMARLEQDAKRPEVAAAIKFNVELGDKLGVTGTPAFIVGEEVISGAVGFRPLQEAIANTRRCGKATCS